MTQLTSRVAKIERALKRLEATRVDPDTILTEEDYRALLSYRDERTRGTLVDGEKLRRELRL
jgi:hypothetical protein